MSAAITSIGFKADAVANEFLAIPAANNQLSPMKLLKLVYFAHGWHLAVTDRPLVNEPVLAWQFGPVVYSIYREFKEFGSQPITRQARDVRFTDGSVEPYVPLLDDREREHEAKIAKALIQSIWSLYGKFTASQLSTMTHEKGTPWHQIVARFGGHLPHGIDIPNEMIRDYFKKQLPSNG